MKKQIPILMSTMMVQAELDGRKTMTRRLTGLGGFNKNPDNWLFDSLSVNKKGELVANFKSILPTLSGLYSVKCPYGQPGDILWVRESYCLSHNKAVRFYKADQTYPDPNGTRVGRPTDYEKGEGYTWSGTKWKSSIHMPKAACRIWLEVTDVRVERLQDISEADAVAEGVLLHARGVHWLNYLDQEAKVTQFIYNRCTAKESFKTLIQLINGRDIWQANPWVWVVKFRVLSTTGKPAGLEERAVIETFLGRPVKEKHEFTVPGTFESMYAAESWVRDRGYTNGSTCVPRPTAIMKGDYYSYGLPHKWKNFTKEQEASVHGAMAGDMRDGPVTVYLFADCEDFDPIKGCPGQPSETDTINKEN